MIVYLSEINRSNLVGKTKDQGNGRYQRRTRYKPDNFRGTDVSQLFDNDVLICPVPVGDYISTVAFQGVLLRLRDQLKEDPRHTLTLQKVIKAITKAIDSSDLLVDCTCPDFVYRFAYWATKYGYKYGKPETRPAKITNPNDKIGAMCKHLTALLANKKWVVKIASIINDYINEYPDEARQAMGLSEDEMVINTYARRLGKMGYYAKLFDRIDKDNEENNQDNQNNPENNSEGSDMVDSTSDISNNADGNEEDTDELELNDNEENDEEGDDI